LICIVIFLQKDHFSLQLLMPYSQYGLDDLSWHLNNLPRSSII